MIIQLDTYRTAQADFANDLDYRDVCGNTVRQPKFDARRQRLHRPRLRSGDANLMLRRLTVSIDHC